MTSTTELWIIGLAFLMGVLNFLLPGIIPCYFLALAVVLILGGRGVLRWFRTRRTAESQ
ncbi:hypothetical protein [Paenarthrobacter nitroguajacolicus]|uniref:hypothetical protein n=1 Tax=Paenarthrobacter nitroguajacolicus TaxID=211146 RepID=UPI0040539B02